MEKKPSAKAYSSSIKKTDCRNQIVDFNAQDLTVSAIFEGSFRALLGYTKRGLWGSGGMTTREFFLRAVDGSKMMASDSYLMSCILFLCFLCRTRFHVILLAPESTDKLGISVRRPSVSKPFSNTVPPNPAPCLSFSPVLA